MDEHVDVFRYNREAENPLFSIIAINGKVAEISLFDMYLGEQPYSKNLFCVCGQNPTVNLPPPAEAGASYSTYLLGYMFKALARSSCGE